MLKGRAHWLAQFVAAALALAGVGLVAAGAWIPAKALFARHLLITAFEQGLALGAAQKPWPSADFSVIGTLTIKHATVAVLDRATGQALAFGAGRHEEIEAGAMVLSGHRDTHFAPLHKVEKGDTVSFNGLMGERRFSVIEVRIVDTRAETIMVPGPRQLMLLTCWPFDAINPDTPWRFLVLADEKGRSA